MSNIVIDIVTQFSGKKAFKEAESASTKLGKNVKKLAATFGVALGGAAVLRFGKNAVKSFGDAEREAFQLQNTVKNLGLAFEAPALEDYINKIGRLYGVTGGQAVPAMQALLGVTGSAARSQDIFNTALDVSAGLNLDVTEVAKGLSQAYLGNTKALKKYNTGLTNAELSAMSFSDIQKTLDDRFKGAATASAKTYTGQMLVLTEASNQAQEIIGKSLVDALKNISGTDTVETLADDMLSFANYTSDAVGGLSILLGKLKEIPIIGGGSLEAFVGAIPVLGAYINLLVGLNRSAKAAENTFNFASGGGAGTSDASRVAEQQRAKAEAAALARAKKLAALQKAALLAEKKAAQLKKLGGIFDIEQAGILAALAKDIAKEDRTRLELQLALLTGNVSEAERLTVKLANAQGLSEALARYLKELPDAKNPFAYLDAYLDYLKKKASEVVIPLGNAGGQLPQSFTPYLPPSTNVPKAGEPGFIGPVAPGREYLPDTFKPYLPSPSANSMGPVSVNVMLDGQILAGAVTGYQTNASLSGNTTQVNRNLGSFAV